MSERDVPAPVERDEYPPAAEPDHDIETPEADAAEQRADVATTPHPDGDRLPERIPFDANEADATEQHRVVEGDDEDYR